jgi:hypothetical protein
MRNEIRYIVNNTIFNLSTGRIKEVEKIERLEIILIKNKIFYYENVEDISIFMSISGLSMSDPDPSIN